MLCIAINQEAEFDTRIWRIQTALKLLFNIFVNLTRIFQGLKESRRLNKENTQQKLIQL